MQDATADKMKDYEIYQADENDIIYTQNYYEQDEKSLTLLKSKLKVNAALLER